MASNSYIVEYAKSGRAKCKDSKCKKTDQALIGKGCVRIGKISPNPFADEGDVMTSWYHARCMFSTMQRMRPGSKKIESEDDLEGFDDLEEKDQKMLQKLISGEDVPPPSPKKSPTKKAAGKKKAPSKVAKKAALVPGDDLSGVTVCITGTLSTMKKAEAKSALQALGAKVVGGVSKNVSVLIAGAKAGSKLAKAEEMGITVWDEDQFNQAIGGGAAEEEEAEEEEEEEEEEDEEKKQPASSGGSLAGKKFVITGTLSMSRKEAKEEIEGAGGKVVGAVSKNVDIIIVGEGTGEKKLSKAEALGIDQWTEDDLVAAL